jgi:hypothetical protein
MKKVGGLLEAALHLGAVDAHAVGCHDDHVVADGRHVPVGVAGDVLQFVGDPLQQRLVVLAI